MDQFHTSAFALQRHLQNLRHELATLDRQAYPERAAQLARLVQHVEQALNSLSTPLKPPSLQ